MYALPRGPSKIVASTRRGPPRVDVSVENGVSSHRNGTMSANAKMVPVFNHNGRYRSIPRQQSSGTYSPYHEETANFLKEVWDNRQSQSRSKGNGPEWYRIKEPMHPSFASKPRFNVDDFIAKTIYQRATSENASVTN